MTVLPKTLLAVAVTGLAGGVVIDSCDISANPALSVVLPAGAVTFGLFLILFMLEKEVACYDMDQQNRLESLPCNTTAAKPRPQSRSQPFMAELKVKTL